MKITVEIPTALRRFTDGVQSIECGSASLPELLGEIEQRFPAISKHLRDESGEVRRFVNIYVNEEDIRFLGGNDYRFREGDRVLVVPSIAGGVSSDACWARVTQTRRKWAIRVNRIVFALDNCGDSIKL